MNTQETLTMVAFLLAPAFFSLLGMGAIGSPAIAILGEISAKTKKRVFFDKYGQQIGAMGLVLLILLLIVDGAAYAVALTKFPQYIHALFSLNSPLLDTFVAFGVFAFVSLIYFTTWKKMRTNKGLHMTLGMVASLAALTCVALAIPAKIAWTLSHGTPSETAVAAAAGMILPMSTMYALLTMSAAAALSAAYLVLRRNKDDFGRDYYNFSLKLAARWATLPMIGFLACQGWLYAVLPPSYKTLVLGTPLVFAWGGVIALGVVCMLLWILIARSASPLRLKGLTFVALLIFWLLHTLNIMTTINLFTML
ncbi:hypothetical protein GO013_04980 [Pseudodesulfovibrio sp. JC047]|uniref:hypothetical protein n=1 Tax=Pseudodesulfovibrio sp. JC047 TaxID=2683199 RepID=UPI0013D82D21|nr:hypothetical protein [Pseudodesulfovibrio sp. JC047]NDV18771.1 hypothetical protein [Pseudodesulfovibrio sp. JC047]